MYLILAVIRTYNSLDDIDLGLESCGSKTIMNKLKGLDSQRV